MIDVLHALFHKDDSVNVKSGGRVTALLFSCLAVFMLSACGSSGPAKDVTISDAFWVIDNRVSENSGASAFLRFWLVFEEVDLEAEDFASIEIEDPTKTRTWTFDEAEDFEEDFFVGEMNSLFATNYLYSSADDGSTLPIGTYTFTITLKNGRTETGSLLVPAPGSLGTEGRSHVYTENFSRASNPPGGYVALPRRGTIEAATLDPQAASLELTFSATDELVFSGWLVAYDAAGDSIGASDDLRDYETGAVMPGLNEGAGFMTEGTSNRLTLSSSQFEFWEDDTSFEDIAALRLILTDGSQYEGTTSTYDTRSVSGLFEVTLGN